MAYIELEVFGLVDTVTREAFLALDAAAQGWCYRHRPGLVRRTTAFNEQGSVLVLTLLAGSSPPAMVESTDDEIVAFRAAIDPATFRRSVFKDLD